MKMTKSNVVEWLWWGERTVKLNPAWDVFKIMLRKLKIMMMEMKYWWLMCINISCTYNVYIRNWCGKPCIVRQIQHLTAVEKHLAGNEKCCRHWKLTRKPCIFWNDTGFFQANPQCAQHYSSLARSFSTAVTCYVCITIIFQFFHMIFNTSQINQFSLWCDVKIMRKNWNMFVMQIQHLTAVEKYHANKMLLILEIGSENPAIVIQ